MPENSTDPSKPLDELERAELEAFKREKERIRRIVGDVGGRETPLKMWFDRIMLTLIIGTLGAAPFLPHQLELPAIEVGLGLLSLKIFFILQNQQRLSHFQFWMLSSLEWRLNDISKRVIRMDKELKQMFDDQIKEKQ